MSRSVILMPVMKHWIPTIIDTPLSSFGDKNGVLLVPKTKWPTWVLEKEKHDVSTAEIVGLLWAHILFFHWNVLGSPPLHKFLLHNAIKRWTRGNISHAHMAHRRGGLPSNEAPYFLIYRSITSIATYASCCLVSTLCGMQDVTKFPCQNSYWHNPPKVLHQIQTAIYAHNVSWARSSLVAPRAITSIMYAPLLK